VAVSYYNYGEVRTDVFYGGPIGNSGDTTATIGGYYRRGDGVKNVGYDTNNGGQFRLTLTHKFDDSTSLTVTYKHIDDHTQLLLPQPVKITQAEAFKESPQSVDSTLKPTICRGETPS